MYTYVCMYVHACLYVCMYVCMYVCVHVQSTLPKLLRESLTYVGTKIKESKEKKTSQAFKLGNYSTCEFDLGRVNCMYVCVCVCVCECVCVCVYVCVYTCMFEKLPIRYWRPFVISAPLSCLAGSHGPMRMRTNIVYFRVMRRLYRRD